MQDMTIQKRIDTFQHYGNQLPGAKVYYREDWDVLYFDLQGKQFGMMSHEAKQDALITLKNLPEKNEELRELYPDVIIPGYYADKKHWNSIKLNSDAVADEEIKKMIDRSYELVYQKLTKVQKEQITE